MNDARRTILWVVFSMSLFLIWDAWNKHTGQPSFFSPPPPTKASATPPPQTASGVPSVPMPTATAPLAPPAPQGEAKDGGERVEILTDVVKATLDSRGGSLVRLELLKQVDPQDPGKNVVLFDQSTERLYIAQTGLVPPTGGGGLPNHHSVMKVVPGERALKDGKNDLQVSFESDDIGGLRLRKTYTFRRSDHVIGVTHEVLNTGSTSATPRLYMQLVRDGNSPPGESSFYFTFTGPALYTDSAKFTKIEFKDIEKRKPAERPSHETEAGNGWIAMVQHYFASAWLIDTPGSSAQPREFFTGKVAANAYSIGMIVPLGELAAGASKSFEARLFVGPQEEDKLAALAPGLELVKDYGYFAVLSKPLFWLLTQLHKLIGNWGWSIVGLVVLLKIAFYWLNATAYRSMAKMKAINPRVMALRERLKDKPQEMQQEMMRIYREEKVNPLGGCLPIFVQMPFFIALYWVLLSSVEMRNAPWIGWIADLSAKDPYFILPLLMTATTMLQTWLNPTPPDPIQARMMWIMPLVFSAMFFVFPAGLVLYWLTNNVLSIAQQYLINKQLGVLGK
jgi:YidC/Oxa1 family membrane protein insertase